MKYHDMSRNQIDNLNPIRRAIYENGSDASFLDHVKKVLEILTWAKPGLIQHNMCQKSLNMLDPISRAEYAPIKREGNILDRTMQMFEEKLMERAENREIQEIRNQPMSPGDSALLMGDFGTPNIDNAKHNFEKKISEKANENGLEGKNPPKKETSLFELYEC